MIPDSTSASARQNWAELLPDEDYRFHFGLKSGSAANFFARTASHDACLQQRAHWLTCEPARYAAVLSEGSALLAETIQLAQTWQSVPSPLGHGLSDDFQKLVALGKHWEPDFLLLKPDAEKRFRLVGGCVCFPSSWRLTDKIGHPLEFIHQPVPQLNSTLASPINQFLSRLRFGTASLRSNWGLSRSPELNQHPEQPVPRLKLPLTLAEVWLRIENQALLALPESGGVLFGIRLEIHSLTTIKGIPEAAIGLARALRTMSAEMAEYKNLLAARGEIVRLLEA